MWSCWIELLQYLDVESSWLNTLEEKIQATENVPDNTESVSEALEVSAHTFLPHIHSYIHVSFILLKQSQVWTLSHRAIICFFFSLWSQSSVIRAITGLRYVSWLRRSSTEAFWMNSSQRNWRISIPAMRSSLSWYVKVSRTHSDSRLTIPDAHVFGCVCRLLSVRCLSSSS